MKNSEIHLTGGARVGFTNATWPFVTLTVSNGKLRLIGTVFGDLEFSREDVVSIKPVFAMPFIGRGIRINHNIEHYKKKIIFWTWENPKELIDQISDLGFVNVK